MAELFAEAPPAPLFAAPSVAPPPPAPAVTAPPITPAPPPPAEVRRSQTNAPWWIAGAGGVVAAVGVGLLIYGVSTAHGGAPGVTAYDLTYGQSQAVGGVGEIATAAGTAALLSGLGWELLRPAPRSTP